eukprot:1332122-Amorphochlora_amoeboformis.AAC.2
MAALFDRSEAVKALMRLGADPSVTNKQKETPITVAPILLQVILLSFNPVPLVSSQVVRAAIQGLWKKVALYKWASNSPENLQLACSNSPPPEYHMGRQFVTH